ncbi:reductase [Nonomuraea sp. WAC 01424]|uniref:NAD-dependent epimerase/dehydratase family protein n=1 Tax=Nonomuraea sp. WAC 01424 TaxID=2203200 RepID=UPI000F7819AD|nr:NAD-dependent epimerase/dehydratase family protein [Nonomuraea sp. WAC 01424]RSN04917.1 reductase [Nonomuraea sp. WAC 01424]
MPQICVIGGSRYFGRHLIRLLQDDGHHVTVVNRGSAAPPAGADHVVADRADAAALTRALAGRTFDAVVDQVCYTPLHADVARRVFAGRTARYVMTSTMEVYDPATSPFLLPPAATPVREETVEAASWPVDPDLPWRSPEALSRLLGEAGSYAEGKRQAEAVFARDPVFPFVAVRSAHVLGGGAADFTGRLRHYVDRVRAGLPVAVHRDPAPTSFVHHEEIAAFLHWTATRSVATGALNAASHGALTVTGLCTAIAAATDAPAPAYRVVTGGEPASPFSFDRPYAIDNGRATALGFPFTEVAGWLPRAVADLLQES